MKKKVVAEEPVIEVVESKVDVVPAPAVKKSECVHKYSPVGNDVPWFEVILVHPNTDPNLMKRMLEPMVVNSLMHTNLYEQACTFATKHAMDANKAGARFLPVSRDGWPPNAAWNYPQQHAAVYVTVDENRAKPGPYRKPTASELLKRTRGPHQTVFELGLNNCIAGRPSIIPQEPEPDESLNDQAKSLMQKGMVKLAEGV
jgi:hypothetical protein